MSENDDFELELMRTFSILEIFPCDRRTFIDFSTFTCYCKHMKTWDKVIYCMACKHRKTKTEWIR